MTHIDMCVFMLDTMVCTGCCATLDNIITYLFKKLTRKQSKPTAVESDTFLRMLELHPDILQQVSCISNIAGTNTAWLLVFASYVTWSTETYRSLTL